MSAGLGEYERNGLHATKNLYKLLILKNYSSVTQKCTRINIVSSDIQP